MSHLASNMNVRQCSGVYFLWGIAYTRISSRRVGPGTHVLRQRQMWCGRLQLRASSITFPNHQLSSVAVTKSNTVDGPVLYWWCSPFREQGETLKAGCLPWACEKIPYPSYLHADSIIPLHLESSPILWLSAQLTSRFINPLVNWPNLPGTRYRGCISEQDGQGFCC